MALRSEAIDPPDIYCIVYDTLKYFLGVKKYAIYIKIYVLCMCLCISKITSRARGVLGVAGRQEVAGVAAGSLVSPAGGRPDFCVTRLLPPATPQSPEQRRTRERYQRQTFRQSF